jgi:hypothetical protein
MTLVAGRNGEADNLLSLYNSSEWGIIISIRQERATSPDPIAELWIAGHSTKTEALTIPSPEIAKGRLTQPRGFFEHRFEHRREITRRGVDDL